MNTIDIVVIFYALPIIISLILVVIYSMLSASVYNYNFFSMVKSVGIYMIFPITNIILILIILIKLIPLIIDFLINSFCEIWNRL